MPSECVVFLARLILFSVWSIAFCFLHSMAYIYNPQCHSSDLRYFISRKRYDFILDFIIWWFATKCLNNEMQLIVAFCIVFQIMELVRFFSFLFFFFALSFSFMVLPWKPKWTIAEHECYVNGIAYIFQCTRCFNVLEFLLALKSLQSWLQK